MDTSSISYTPSYTPPSTSIPPPSSSECPPSSQLLATQGTEGFTHPSPLALFLQPACIQHKYIRTPNSSHIYERPERIRAVMLGVASGVANLEREDEDAERLKEMQHGKDRMNNDFREQSPGLESLLSGLSIKHVETIDPVRPSKYIYLPPVPAVPPLEDRGKLLVNHPAVRYAHSSGWEMPFPSLAGSKVKRERVRGVGMNGEALGGPLVHFKLGTTPTSSSTSSTTPLKPITPRGTPTKQVVPAQSQIPTSQYLRDLRSWGLNAPERIKATGCEIPDDRGLNVGDLYLGPGSVDAIEGCIQTVAAAVDLICSDGEPPARNAFCVIRPPGHHCGEDTPSGFCYINNVVVGAMHAYLMHDYDRAVVIDFDLHHGNGTQSIIMGLNESSQAEELLRKGGKPLGPMSEEEEDIGRRRRCWKGFYGSLHDIWSYPCEDGDIDLIKDASVSLAGHGQYIENIHLQPYDSEEDFYERLYPRYKLVLKAAEQYVKETEADPGRTIVFISAGFDACDYEHQTMQRHDRRVPPSFFSHFTRDIKVFADKWANGKVISVLEGGYSDRALATGAMSHIHGFARAECEEVPVSWWSEDNVAKLERVTKRKRTGRLATPIPECVAESHLLRTHALLDHFDCHGTSRSTGPHANSYIDLVAEAPRRTLRERKKPLAPDTTPPTLRTLGGKPKAKSTSSTPVHVVQPPKVPATEGRPTETDVQRIPPIPAIPDRGIFADALEASMQKMSLERGVEQQTPKTTLPSTPVHAYVHAVASGPIHPSAVPRLQDLLNPQSPSPVSQGAVVESDLRDSSHASTASSPDDASLRINSGMADSPSPAMQHQQVVLERNEQKIFLKFSLPKTGEEEDG